MTQQTNQETGARTSDLFRTNPKITVRKSGVIVKTIDYETGTDLRQTLRGYYDGKGQDMLEHVPSDLHDMTYEHALMLVGIDNADSFKIQILEGPTVRPEDLIEQDLGQATQLVIDLLPAEVNRKNGAISIIDMNTDTSDILVAWAKGKALEDYLATFGLKPSPRTVNKGITFREVIAVVEKMRKVDLSNNSFSNYATRKDVVMDDVVPEKDALSEEGITLLAAKPITGNES